MRGLAVGLMSGTSADGVDAALVAVDDAPAAAAPVRLVRFRYEPYDAELRRRIHALFAPQASLVEAAAMHVVLGRRFGAVAASLLRDAGVAPDDVDVVGSHGQTVAHYPAGRPEDGSPPFTLQIGDPASIAEAAGVPVVSDLRAHDMALGGQAAPLVPYFDHALFASARETRVLLNIGGIANITVLAAGAGADAVRAFDTGPGNMVLDAAVERLSEGRLRFDADGAWAERGVVDEPFVRRLLEHPYFALPAPKTTGRETFGAAYTDAVLAEARSRGLDAAATLATLTAFVGDSIAAAIRGATAGPVALIAAGGGVHNRTLMARIAAGLDLLRPWQATEAYGVPADAKEAMAFAYMAWQFLRGRATNLPAATGARAGVALGSWTPVVGRPFAVVRPAGDMAEREG